MLASCPPTSGATRISVTRTRPVIGGDNSRCNSKYPLTLPAIAMTPSAMIRPLRMRQPPLDESGRENGKAEISDCEQPQVSPIARDFPHSRAELADTHEGIDRQI